MALLLGCQRHGRRSEILTACALLAALPFSLTLLQCHFHIKESLEHPRALLLVVAVHLVKPLPTWLLRMHDVCVELCVAKAFGILDLHCG